MPLSTSFEAGRKTSKSDTPIQGPKHAQMRHAQHGGRRLAAPVVQPDPHGGRRDYRRRPQVTEGDLGRGRRHPASEAKRVADLAPPDGGRTHRRRLPPVHAVRSRSHALRHRGESGQGHTRGRSPSGLGSWRLFEQAPILVRETRRRLLGEVGRRRSCRCGSASAKRIGDRRRQPPHADAVLAAGRNDHRGRDRRLGGGRRTPQFFGRCGRKIGASRIHGCRRGSGSRFSRG